MSTPRRRAIWFAAAVSVLVFALGATMVSSSGSGADQGAERATAHQVVADHDAVVSVRPVADRAPLDLRHLQSKLLLLAWVGVLLVAALLARTAGRVVEDRSRRARPAVVSRQRFVRGPPAPSFS